MVRSSAIPPPRTATGSASSRGGSSASAGGRHCGYFPRRQLARPASSRASRATGADWKARCRSRADDPRGPELEALCKTHDVALFRFSDARLREVPRTTLEARRIRERQDLQAALRDSISVLGEDLLVVAEEYGRFADSQRRIDLLAVDRSGSLVVIELKRTDTGGHMELQALRYAAMVSTMTIDDLVEAYADFAAVSLENARLTLDNWTDEPIVELDDRVRIVLVSGDFSTEITSTVLWLGQHYNVEISCYRVVVYNLDDETLVDVQQIIPLPEARAFQIQQRKKETSAIEKKASGRDFTKYDIAVGGESRREQSKQAAVKFAVQRLLDLGVPLQIVQKATNPKRWITVHPTQTESVAEAFEREFPTRGTHYWFDMRISNTASVWVMPRFGGPETEPFLSALQRVTPPEVGFTWNRSTPLDEF